MKNLLKILVIIIGSLLILLIALVQKIDRTPLQETKHYQAWNNWIVQKEFRTIQDSLQVGWSKVHIVPDFSAPMSGYGDRWGKHFEGIRDSLYVRTISLRTGDQFMTFLSADLLLVPPNVTHRLKDLLKIEGISMNEIHLGAIHTHHGVGGWGQKLLGRLFAGKYDERIEIMLAERMRDAIVQSRLSMRQGHVLYLETEYEQAVRNRLKVEGATVEDAETRNLIFERIDGQRAALLTFAAHTTILPADLLKLSRDYPGITVDSLENSGHYDFAMFFAGAVGSMTYEIDGETPEIRSEQMGQQFADHILKHDTSSTTGTTPIVFFSEWVPVPLPPATLRIDINYALRPWVFNSLFGSSPGDIKVSLIDRTLVLGMPADFSGEIMVELDAYARSKGLDLIVTSFNGNYMGYITHDQHYEENMYETVTMSWNGYQAGDYYTQVSKDIIDKIAKNFTLNR